MREESSRRQRPPTHVRVTLCPIHRDFSRCSYDAAHRLTPSAAAAAAAGAAGAEGRWVRTEGDRGADLRLLLVVAMLLELVPAHLGRSGQGRGGWEVVGERGGQG